MKKPNTGLIKGERAKDYAIRSKESEATMKTLEFILENLRFSKKTVIVDLAAGSGNYERSLKGRVKSIDAVELSEEMVSMMRKEFKGSNVNVIKSDIINTCLKSGSYDAALFIMSLHHVKDAESSIAEVARLLKPNGSFILVDRVPRSNILNRMYDSLDAKRKGVKEGYGHYYRNRKSLETSLSKNFTIKKSVDYPYDGFKGLIITRMMYCLVKK